MKFRKSYPFVVWATSILISPFIFLLGSLLPGESRLTAEDFSLLPIFWIFGSLYSLPALALYWLAFYYLQNKIESARAFKCILIAVACLGVYITFVVMGGRFTLDITTLWLMLPYWIGIIISSLIFRIREKIPQVPARQDTISDR